MRMTNDILYCCNTNVDILLVYLMVFICFMLNIKFRKNYNYTSKASINISYISNYRYDVCEMVEILDIESVWSEKSSSGQNLFKLKVNFKIWMLYNIKINLYIRNALLEIF